MNVTLWIIAAILALTFVAAGATKLARPRAELEPNMPWVADATDGQVRAVGAIEIFGAVGLVLPAAFDIAPVLVPVAATGLVVVMIGAVIVHVRRSEPFAAAVPAIVLGILSAVVAIGRFGPEAF